MNKKGAILTLAMLFVATAVYSQAFFIRQQLQTEILDEGLLGERAYSVVKMEEEHQRAQLYLDQAASTAYTKSVNELKANSGYNIAPCGEYAGIPYWRGKGDEQSVRHCKRDVIKELRQKMELKLEKSSVYPGDAVLPKRWDVFIQDGEMHDVIGTALEPLKISRITKIAGIEHPQSLESFTSFRLKKKNRLNFDEERELAEKIIDECIGVQDVGLEKCVFGVVQKKDPAMKMGILCTDEVLNDPRSFVFCKDIKFALYIPTGTELAFTTWRVRGSGKEQNWLKKVEKWDKVFIVNAGEEVEMETTLTTSGPDQTSVELCEENSCKRLYYRGSKLSDTMEVKEGRRTLSLKYKFVPEETKIYYLKAKYIFDGKISEETKTDAQTLGVA